MYHIWYKAQANHGKESTSKCNLECLHQVLTQMLRTAELDMAETVTPDDVDDFLDNAAWAMCSTYIIQSLKPLQMRQYLDATCSSTFRS